MLLPQVFNSDINFTGIATSTPQFCQLVHYLRNDPCIYLFIFGLITLLSPSACRLLASIATVDAVILDNWKRCVVFYLKLRVPRSTLPFVAASPFLIQQCLQQVLFFPRALFVTLQFSLHISAVYSFYDIFTALNRNLMTRRAMPPVV